MRTLLAKFAVGQIVRHALFNYRGVVLDVDPTFRGDDEWYREMAPSRPPKNRPWYKVLMDDTDAVTYVAERNLELDASGDPIRHPDLDTHFAELKNGVYQRRRRGN